MDPAACLAAADQAISDLELEEARDHLADYRSWRNRDGFEPLCVAGTFLHGDAFAQWCERRIEGIEWQQEVQ